jgi:hypothetical protein
VVFIMSLISGKPMAALLLATAISFVLSSIYFILLNKFYGTGIIYWLILIAGFAIGLV